MKLTHWPLLHERLRMDWRARFEKAKALGAEAEGIAYGLTPQTIAATAWSDVHLYAVEEGRATTVRPVPVAWYSGFAQPAPELSLEDLGPPAAPVQDVEREVSVLFRRELERPLTHDPEESLHIAVRLAADDDFTRARRSLFEWELMMAAQEVPPSDAV